MNCLAATDVPRAARMLSHLPMALGVPLRKLTQGWIGKITSPKYAGLAEYGRTLAGAYLLRRALYMPWELEAFMEPDMAREGLERLQLMPRLEAQVAGLKDPYLAVMLLELTVYMRDRLVRDADWASMAHSLELRTPLVDWTLFSYLAPGLVQIPRPDKNMLAAVAADRLPAGIQGRPKTGFAVPVSEWLLKEQAGNPRGLRSFFRLVYDRFGA